MKIDRWMQLGTAAALLAAMVPAGPAAAQETSIRGLFFGDYYYVAGHHDADLKDANGFWARRMYLTVNSRLNDKWDARVRFEAATRGDFTTSATMDPFLKDLWVRYRTGRHRILIGLSSSPTWDHFEGEWGYRHLEKTPLDLFKMGSSRDFGVSVMGALDEAGKLSYHLMFGNGASTKTETNKGKKLMGALTFAPTDRVAFQVYADREDRAGDKDRTTYHANVVVKGERGRVGALVTRQTRNDPGGMDTDVDVFSVFGVLDASEKVSLIGRWDRMATPIPDGAKISYFRMSPDSKGNFFLLGLDLKVADRVSLIPNVEFVTYDDDALDTDVFLRTTFFVRF